MLERALVAAVCAYGPSGATSASDRTDRTDRTGRTDRTDRSGRSGRSPRLEDLKALVDAAGQDDLVDLAIAQRSAGPASRVLTALLAEGPRTALLSRVNADILSHMSHLGLLVKLGAALDNADVPWVVVKGPVLAELAYGGTPRHYSDLDVVVPAEHFRLALEVLTSRGARTVDRNWDLVTRDLRGQLHLGLGPQLIDLHWHLVNLANQRDRFAVPMDDLFTRRRRVQVGTVKAWTLDATDAVLHVALHAALAGGHQLGWLIDVERSVVSLDPDWDALVERSHAWRTDLPVAVVLNRAREVLMAPVPLDVIRQLSRGSAGHLFVHSLRKWTPSGRLPGGGSVDRAVTRSLRDGYPATAIQVARLAYEMLQRHFDPHEYWLDPDDPRNVLYSSGNDEGLERYLQHVAAVDRYGHGDQPSAALSEARIARTPTPGW
jgi:hypothetical protein